MPSTDVSSLKSEAAESCVRCGHLASLGAHGLCDSCSPAASTEHVKQKRDEIDALHERLRAELMAPCDECGGPLGGPHPSGECPKCGRVPMRRALAAWLAPLPSSEPAKGLESQAAMRLRLELDDLREGRAVGAAIGGPVGAGARARARSQASADDDAFVAMAKLAAEQKAARDRLEKELEAERLKNQAHEKRMAVIRAAAPELARGDAFGYAQRMAIEGRSSRGTIVEVAQLATELARGLRPDVKWHASITPGGLVEDIQVAASIPGLVAPGGGDTWRSARLGTTADWATLRRRDPPRSVSVLGGVVLALLEQLPPADAPVETARPAPAEESPFWGLCRELGAGEFTGRPSVDRPLEGAKACGCTWERGQVCEACAGRLVAQASEGDADEQTKADIATVVRRYPSAAPKPADPYQAGPVVKLLEAIGRKPVEGYTTLAGATALVREALEKAREEGEAAADKVAKLEAVLAACGAREG